MRRVIAAAACAVLLVWCPATATAGTTSTSVPPEPCAPEFKPWIERLLQELVELQKPFQAMNENRDGTLKDKDKVLAAIDDFAKRAAAHPLDRNLPNFDPDIRRDMQQVERTRQIYGLDEGNTVTFENPGKTLGSLAGRLRDIVGNSDRPEDKMVAIANALQWANAKLEFLEDYCARVEQTGNNMTRNIILGGIGGGIGILATTLGGGNTPSTPVTTSPPAQTTPVASPTPTQNPNPTTPTTPTTPPGLNGTVVNGLYQGTAERRASTCGNALPTSFSSGILINNVNEAGSGGTLIQQGPFGQLNFPINSVQAASGNTMNLTTQMISVSTPNGLFQVAFQNLRKLVELTQVQGMETWTRISGGPSCEDSFEVRATLGR